MADPQDPTTAMGGDPPAEAGPPGPTGAGGRRWLRWGSVYVDIEPPQAPNPWTTPGRAVPPSGAVPPPPPGTPGRRSRRPALLFVLGAVVAVLLGVLLSRWLADDEDRAVLAVATTTSRPAPPSTRPATTTAPAPATTRPAGTTTVPSSATTATTAPGAGGGRITVPEGLPPASAPTTPARPSTTTGPSTTPPTTVAPAPTSPSNAPTTTNPEPVAFLGITVEESPEGPRIVDVLPGTGAEAAGLLPLDVVTDVDTTPVATADELGAAIQSRRPGDSITVTVLRNGTSQTVRATLGQR